MRAWSKRAVWTNKGLQHEGDEEGGEEGIGNGKGEEDREGGGGGECGETGGEGDVSDYLLALSLVTHSSIVVGMHPDQVSGGRVLRGC